MLSKDRQGQPDHLDQGVRAQLPLADLDRSSPCGLLLIRRLSRPLQNSFESMGLSVSVARRPLAPFIALSIHEHHNLRSTALSSFIDRLDVSIGSRLIRSYSAMTCAPTSRTSAPISTLNSTAIAVVSEP
jgi:hypothetical protein